MQQDVDQVVRKYVAMRNKAIMTSVAIATVVGGTVGYAVWAWTEITLSVLPPDSGHVAASWFYGWLLFAIALYIFEGLDFDGYVVPDEALAELSRLEIRNKAALAELRESLKQNGAILLTEMEQFSLREGEARILEQTLSMPGAHALIATESSNEAPRTA